MLSNKGFISKAPQAKIDEEKAKLKKYKEMLEKIWSFLGRVKKGSPKDKKKTK